MQWLSQRLASTGKPCSHQLAPDSSIMPQAHVLPALHCRFGKDLPSAPCQAAGQLSWPAQHLLTSDRIAQP